MSAVEAASRVQQIAAALAALAAPSASAASPQPGADFEALLGAATDVATAASGTATPTSADAATAAVQGGPGATLPPGVTGDDIVAAARRYLGTPYVFGGDDANGIDCSGLVQAVLASLGLTTGHLVSIEAQLGTAVPSLAQAKPGDLIVEKGNRHIQIYAGGGKVIEAPRPGENVVERPEWLDPSEILTIRRVTAPETDASPRGTATAASSASLLATSAPTPAADIATTILASYATASAAQAAAAQAASPLAAASVAPPIVSIPASTTLTVPQQLTHPIVTLVHQGGESSVVVRVVPESLGPVTVTAHLHDTGLRIDLATPTAEARDALSGMLADLRRDLAANGISANLGLDTGAGGDGARAFREQQHPLFAAVAPASVAAEPSAVALTTPSDLALDVLA